MNDRELVEGVIRDRLIASFRGKRFQIEPSEGAVTIDDIGRDLREFVRTPEGGLQVSLDPEDPNRIVIDGLSEFDRALIDASVKRGVDE